MLTGRVAHLRRTKHAPAKKTKKNEKKTKKNRCPGIRVDQAACGPWLKRCGMVPVVINLLIFGKIIAQIQLE